MVVKSGDTIAALTLGNMKTISGKLLLGVVGLAILCLCVVLSAAYNRFADPPPTTPTSQGADSLILITWTPLPAGSATSTGTTTPTSTPVPTRTPLPTSLPTRSFETPTTVILPTVIRPVTITGLVMIVGVDKKLEFVDIQNLSGAPVSLRGWILLSERGEQSCELNGILQPNAVLRIWAGTNDIGYSCGFLRTIWTDNELDPAVLYNSRGEEISRYPP